jgi:polyisoprenoid-binding protein YceI
MNKHLSVCSSSRLLRAALLAVAVASASCSSSEPAASALPKATLAAAATPTTAAADAAVLAFDERGSKLGYVGRKVTGSHPGTFGAFSGEVRLGKTEADSTVNLTIRMDSITSDSDRLTGHLKSADFFDVAAHPTTTFSSTGIVAGAGAGGATHTVQGNLTMRGVVKNISFPATITRAADRLTLKAAFTFDRRAFDLNYPGKPNDLIADDVELNLDIVATPAPAAPAAVAAPAAAAVDATAPTPATAPATPATAPATPSTTP